MLNKLKGSYFARLMLTHMTVMLLLIAIVGGLLLEKTGRMMTEELRMTGESRITSVKQKLERDTLESYHAAVLNRALSTVRPEVENDITFFLEHGKGESYYRVAQFAQGLKTLTFTLPLLHNISFYFQKDDFLVDEYYHVSPDTSPQAELLRGEEPIVPHKWYTRTVRAEDQDSDEQTTVLTYIHTLPFLAKGKQIRGYMIVDLDAAKVFAAAAEQLGHEERMIIYDRNGVPVEQSGEVDAATAQWLDGKLGAQQGTTLKLGEEVVTISPADASLFGWQYALIRPQYSSLLMTQRMKYDIGVIALVLLLFGLLISVAASRQAYSTYSNVVKRIRTVTGLNKRSSKQNEMGFVEHALGYLDQQKRTYQQARKEKQWRNLLSGAAQSLDDELLLPEANQYVTVYIELDGVDSERFYSLLQQEPAGAEVRGDWITLTKTTAFWVLMTELDPERLRSTIARSLEHAAHEAGASVRYRAGMGSAADRREDLPGAAVEAQTAAKYGFLEPGNTVLRFEEVQHRRAVYPDVNLEAFELLLRSGSVSEVGQFLEAGEAALRASGHTMEMVELVTMQLKLCIAKVRMTEQDGSSENERTLRRLPFTLAETMEQLREQSAELVLGRTEKRNERKARILADIQGYIQENIHEDISLDQLTELTSYSKQFICKLFKDELQMTFVDYMTNERLEKAASLLVLTDDSIGRIAERSGFRSSQYLATKFKAKFGVSPVQYRQASGENRLEFNSGCSKL
ncbi:AraC family transcriptional regulator [Paenibacillus sp. HB172176]|uniref:AraC family transcriptional regulator n=1 Tax=Paenibacillus sp. HB172176 TaxID=2493690 RepID=UPI001439B32B|nr:AraC family transcriptional regulator [Paenibacillus sp. HB172176]